MLKGSPAYLYISIDEYLCTSVHLHTCISGRTRARVAVDVVVACGVIITRVRGALVNVRLTARA